MLNIGIPVFFFKHPSQSISAFDVNRGQCFRKKGGTFIGVLEQILRRAGCNESEEEKKEVRIAV
jgi:hypothetical protein